MTLTIAGIKAAFDLIFYWVGVWAVMVGGTVVVTAAALKIKRFIAFRMTFRRGEAHQKDLRKMFAQIAAGEPSGAAGTSARKPDRPVQAAGKRTTRAAGKTGTE